MKRYKTVEDGEWTSWDRKGNKEQCCDCLLIHLVEFRIVKRGKRQFIEFRCFRDDKATAQARKRGGITLSQSPD